MKKFLQFTKLAVLFVFGVLNAQSVTFNYKPNNDPTKSAKTCYGQIQSWQIPAGVTKIRITATGGGGGYSSKAATVTADYTVTPGMYINMLVAGKAKSWDASGGGGTFVTYESTDRNGENDFASANNVSNLILAAGGGGSNADATTSLSTNPTSLSANNGGSGSKGGIAGGNGGINSTDFISGTGESYGGYGGGGSYGFSGGGSGGSFGGSATPPNASYTYAGGGGFKAGSGFDAGSSWISNNTLGVIAGTQVGTINVTNSNNGSVVITYGTVLSTNDHIISYKKLYPNPANSEINFISTLNQIAQIFSLDGKVIMSLEVKKGENKIDISSLSTGSYILKTKEGSQKFIKK